MRINVEKRHIKFGIRNSGCRCPIALAVKEHIKYGIWVTPTIIAVCKEKYYMSKRTMKFIEYFDSGKPVEPFSFNLKI